MSLAHREACEAVANWAMGLRWCTFAVVEIAGRSFPCPDRRPAFTYPRTPEQIEALDAWTDRERAWRATPAAGGGVLDVLAMSHPTAAKRRLAIYEVKTTVSDLRADLRRGKMLRYEPQATHCFLAGPAEVLGAAEDAGLPSAWGMVQVNAAWSVYHQRAAKPTGVVVTEAQMYRIAVSAAKSLAYRSLRDVWALRRAVEQREDAWNELHRLRTSDTPPVQS